MEKGDVIRIRRQGHVWILLIRMKKIGTKYKMSKSRTHLKPEFFWLNPSKSIKTHFLFAILTHLIHPVDMKEMVLLKSIYLG